MSMTKFETEDDPGFVSVTGELRRWVKGLGPVIADLENSASECHTAKKNSQNYNGSNAWRSTHHGNNIGRVNVTYGGFQINNFGTA
jgi:hypothetical protein